jgi:phenylalanyl-tRNA synthetase beta chain
VCRPFDLPARTVAAEIDLDALIAAAPPGGEVPLVSGFPVAKEDVALVVAADVPAAAVERALRTGAGPLLESLALFDVYTGPPVPPGQVSLAYALRFRAPDRTLTDAETAAARDAAVAAAAEQTGAVQRTL